MTGLPSELRDLADWLENFKQEKDGGDTTSLDWEIMSAISGCDDSIHDSLLIYKSVEIASEFRARFSELYEGACSPDTRISSMVPWEAGRFAKFCRRLATAIEGELPADQQASEVTAIEPGSPTSAGKMEHGGVPPAADGTVPKVRLAELEIAAMAEEDPPRAKTAALGRDKKKGAGDYTPKQLEMMGKARALEKAICKEIEHDEGKSLTHILKSAAVTHERFNNSTHFEDARSAWESLDSKRKDAAHFRKK